MSGTATPFADNIAVDATLAVSGIELGKIETYTGLLGFSPSTGRMDLTAETKGSKVYPTAGSRRDWSAEAASPASIWRAQGSAVYS